MLYAVENATAHAPILMLLLGTAAAPAYLLTHLLWYPKGRQERACTLAQHLANNPLLEGALAHLAHQLYPRGGGSVSACAVPFTFFLHIREKGAYARAQSPPPPPPAFPTHERDRECMRLRESPQTPLRHTHEKRRERVRLRTSSSSPPPKNASTLAQWPPPPPPQARAQARRERFAQAPLLVAGGGREKEKKGERLCACADPSSPEAARGRRRRRRLLCVEGEREGSQALRSPRAGRAGEAAAAAGGGPRRRQQQARASERAEAAPRRGCAPAPSAPCQAPSRALALSLVPPPPPPSPPPPRPPLQHVGAGGQSQQEGAQLQP